MRTYYNIIHKIEINIDALTCKINQQILIMTVGAKRFPVCYSCCIFWKGGRPLTHKDTARLFHFINLMMMHLHSLRCITKVMIYVSFAFLSISFILLYVIWMVTRILETNAGEKMLGQYHYHAAIFYGRKYNWMHPQCFITQTIMLDLSVLHRMQISFIAHLAPYLG